MRAEYNKLLCTVTFPAHGEYVWGALQTTPDCSFSDDIISTADIAHWYQTRFKLKDCRVE